MGAHVYVSESTTSGGACVLGVPVYQDFTYSTNAAWCALIGRKVGGYTRSGLLWVERMGGLLRKVSCSGSFDDVDDCECST